jgi:hypothetical protein
MAQVVGEPIAVTRKSQPVDEASSRTTYTRSR